MARFESYEQGTPNWVEHLGPDQQQAKSFYQQLFGWDYDETPIDDQGNVYSQATIEGDRVGGLGTHVPEQGGQPAGWNVYLAADDVDAAAQRALEAGGQVVAGPFDVMDAGRMAFVQDPGGAVVGFWQANQHIGSQRANEPGANIWNELVTADVDKVAPFYEATLGIAALTQDMGTGGPPYTVLTVAGKSVAGTAQLPADGVPSHWNVYFNVEDVDATITRAKELGAEETTPAFSAPGVGRFGFLRDPQGAHFNLMSNDPG